MSTSQVQFFELAEQSRQNIQFVTLLVRYQGGWLHVRQEGRQSWEWPGGKVEAGETPQQAAARELREETGATVFEVRPSYVYSYDGSFGVQFVGEVMELGGKREGKMAEVRTFAALPDALTYPEIYTALFEHNFQHHEANA